MESTDKSHYLEDLKVARPGRNPHIHGEIPGFPVGSRFENRMECSRAGVHAPLRAGIHGNATEGGYSIVLSGGYEDDEDNGDTITYTGQGGRDNKGSKLDQLQGKIAWEGAQNADQEWVRGNKALKISKTTGKPVRVIRGHTLDSRYSPAEGYRYDGLYVVVDAWRAVGKTGFKTCRFTFQRLPGQPPLPGTQPAARIQKMTNNSGSHEALPSQPTRLTDTNRNPGQPSRIMKMKKDFKKGPSFLHKSMIIQRPPLPERAIQVIESDSSDSYKKVPTISKPPVTTIKKPFAPPHRANPPPRPSSAVRPLQMYKVGSENLPPTQRNLKRQSVEEDSSSDDDSDDDEEDERDSGTEQRWDSVRGKTLLGGLRFKKMKIADN